MRATRTRTATITTGVVLAASAGLSAAVLTSPAAAATGRSEVSLPADPRSPGVAASLVTISAPLPASAGSHPAACDSLSYLRYRSTSGPTASAKADKILLAEPGALAGASSLDLIGRHTVADAKATGKNIEFWALDRRANCLEDNSGLVAAVAAKDPTIALEYYTKGRTVGGRTFAGYVPDKDLGWLKNMGMQQTVKDEYTLLTRELPDPATRAGKVWCGGHSLGGVVTAFFAMSDFDGDPATLGDAGYKQCAGYFALDTAISTSLPGAMPPAPSAVPGLVASGKGVVDAAYDLGVIPHSLNIPVINPETINLLALAGAYATTRPTGLSPLPSAFGGNGNVTLALRFLLSKDAGTFLTGIPDVTKVKITNQGALGALMDDNSSPIAIIQESVGFFTGGRIVDKSFPTSNDLTTVDALKGLTAFATGTQRKAIPDDVGPIWDQGTGPVYGWLNYDQVTRDGSNVAKDSAGKPFTTAASEVTDITDLSKVLSAYPLDFTEHYFPLSMITDTLLWGAGDRTVVPTAVHPEGLTAHATVSLLGGEGVIVPGSTGPQAPNTLVLPGYQHLDVLTAAATQNTGQPEKGAAYLSRFVLSH